MRKNKKVKVILLIIILFGMSWFTLPGSFAIFKESLGKIIYLNIEDPTGFIITFNPQNGSSNTQIVRDYGEKIGPLDYPTKSGEIFDGWYTAPTGGTKVSGNTLATGTTTYYAHYNPIICRPASTLHTASNHTYGIIPNSTHLAVGFAYDCDVDGDGTFSASDERFYYLTDDENGNSLFIYSNNVHEGSPMCGADGVLYNTDRLNNLPPTNAYLELPTTTQWSNVSLHNQPRQITTETGGTTTSKGSTTTFTYTNRAARFVTTQELDRACGLDIANGTNNYNSACFFLKENTNIEVSSCRSNWWTETPKSSGGNYIYRIDKNGTVASVDVTPTDKGFSAVRPLIEVPKESVVLYGNPKTFNVAFDSQGGSAVASYDILEGDEIGELTEPTRHSYTFSGWYTEPTGGTLVGEHTVPTGDVTYYAHWTLVPSYTVHFDAQGGSAVADKPVAHDSAVGELPTTTKAGLVFAGWYTQGGTLVTEATIIDAEVTFYAHWDSYLCKRAKAGELHTAECEQTGGNGCIRDYSNGDTITYGNTSVTAGTLNYGDAFDCDVNNDGVYDSVTERFYYVGSNGNNSSLIYYANIANDGTTITVPSQSNYAYDSSGENYHGPATGYTVLPGTSQWSNPNLNLPGTRFVTNNAGGTTTDSGTNTIDGLTYTGKAARLLTSQELATACGAGTPTNTGYLDNCNYLMENIGLYETTTGNSGYWLENPSASTEDTALTVLGVSGKIADDDVTVSNAYGIRPVIDLPTKYINSGLRVLDEYTIEFDSRGGSTVSDKIIEEGHTLGTLTIPKKDGNVFEGWFTSASGGEEVTSSTIPTKNETYYAHWTPLVCRRADVTTFHTETCSRSSGGCFLDGYTNGGTITYGNQTVTSGVLTAGDAFDCDVDNDGTYDPVTERFYYVSPKYIGSTDSFDNTKAVLIYYSDVKDGVANNTQTSAYDTNNQNWNGPISAYSHLPSTTQWDNPLLEGNETRNIRNELGGTTTMNGSNTIVASYTYTDKAARFITYQEVVEACGSGAESQSGTHGIKKMVTGCNYLMERVPAYLTNVTKYGYWLETPYSANAEVERISGGDVSLEPREVKGAGSYMIRPAITIPVKYIEKTIPESLVPTVELTAKSDMAYNGSAQAANTAVVTVEQGDTFSGTITYTYYTDSSCTLNGTTIAPTNAGNYYVKASTEAFGNYNAGESSCVAHTIAKSDTTTTQTNISVIYNGSAIVASGATSTLNSNNSVVSNGEYTYTYYSDNSCSGIALANAPTEVGDYGIKATLIAADNYNSSTSGCALLTLEEPLIPTVTLTEKENMVYDGTAKTPNEATVTLSNNETYTGEINYNYYTDNACTVPYTGTPICKRVTDSSKLHTETCTNSDTENYCQGDGYASGATITYGNVRVGSTFTTGDAFNCDVNGDGTYDDTTERFYYVSDYYDTNTQSFDSSTAVLIYYKNFVNGVASESGAAYDLSNENWHGPVTALTNLPSTTGANAWRNDLLKTSTRKILACLNENCSSVSGSTSGGDLPTAFSYEGSAGRLITGKEIFSGCYNGSALINTGSLSDKCKFLFEGTKYADSSKATYGSWLESPLTSVSSSVWVVGVSYRYLRNVVSTDIARGVRPVIDVPKFKIDTSIIPSDAGSYYVKASVGSSNNYLAGESSCVAHTIAKSDTTTTLNAITNTYNGSAQAATGAVSTLNSNSSIISSGSYTYTYYSGNSCDGIALAGAPTNPGEYRVKATLTATDNYNSSTSSCTAYTMNDTSATITINKDGSLWNNNGMQVALYQNGTEAYPYNSGVVSGNTITFSTILPGTYDLYVSRDENNVNTLVDSGVDAVVTTTESATINYYTLSMTTTHATLSLNSDSFTSGDSVVVLGNIEHTISVTPENNYMLSTWSKTSGTVTFDNATSATTTVVVSAASEIEAVTTERTKQRVTFDNDGVETYVDVDLDESLGDDMPEDPTKSGYIFVGWFIDGDITKPFDKDTQVSGDLDVVAVWTEDTNMARIGNQYFTTLNLAVQAVPTTGVETEIIILKDATVSGRPQSSANQNIKLIGGNHTLTCGDNNILYNYGTLTIVDGTYISGVSGKGVFDTVGGSHTYIIGGTISNTNDRAAVYNAGYLEISGDAHLTSVASDRPVIHNYQTTSEVVVKGGLIEQTNASCKRGAIQNEKSTGKVTVTGGTIKSSSTNSAAGGIQMGEGTLVIGTQNGTHDSTSPVIMGVKYGVNSSVNYSFYDGIIKGVTAAVNDESKITNKEDGVAKVTGTETIEGTTYNTLTYEVQDVYTINLDANEGTVSPDYVNIIIGNSIANQSELPTPTRGIYTFDGWYTSKTTQDNTTAVTYPITPSAQGSTTFYAKWVYNASNTPVLFNTTNDVMQVYYDNIDTWSANKSTFETDMMENFTDHNCSACDQPNSCKNPLAGEYCERPKGYETGVSSINVYPYDVTNQQVGNTPVSYITTVDGTIYNMIPGESYYWESTEDSNIHGIVTAEADDNRRTIYTTVRNVRDLGGMTAVNDTISGTLKYEKLYRGAELHTGTDGDNDVASLTKLGITREIDLRADSEGKNKGQKYLTVYDITASNNPNLYIPADNAATEDVVITNYSINPVATEFITAAHPNEYAAFKKYMKAIMRYIAYGDDSIYFHCTIGSDRTGTMAYFLEGLLGVSLEDRLRDYELSYFFGMTNRHRFHDYLSGSQINPRFESMYKSYDTYQKIYDFYTYGDTAAEIEEADQLLRDFRIAMIDGVISSKTATVSLVPKSNMVYDGTEKAANTATVTLESPDVYEGTINYTYYTDSSCTTGATTTAPTNAGSYYVKASIAAFGDYSAAESSCVAHIVAKSDTTTSLTAITNTYNGSAQTATGATSILSNSNAITNGTYTYTYYEGTSCDGTALANAPINAGDYRIKATLAGTDNYNSSTSSCTIFTINKATPTVSLTSKTASYTGSEVPANAATVTLVNNETYNGIVDYTYYTDSSCTTGATTTAPTNVGSYYVKASIAAFGDYNAAESSCVAHTIESSVPQPVCKRATSLHTATCNRTSDGCYEAGYYSGGSKGTTTITYGNLGTGETLTPGDAFDCDVNQDGTYDAATERFYYVTSSGDNAVLIYYTNVNDGTAGVGNGVGSTGNVAYYASANENWHGPVTAYEQLPSTTQWKNSGLIAPGTRQITAETGATSTSGGTIESFTYTNKAARFLTYQEVASACGSSGMTTAGYLNNCTWLMENLGQYEGSSGAYGYWLETPRSDRTYSVWVVYGNSRNVNSIGATNASRYGVRPVITVLKSNISY